MTGETAESSVNSSLTFISTRYEDIGIKVLHLCSTLVSWEQDRRKKRGKISEAPVLSTLWTRPRPKDTERPSRCGPPVSRSGCLPDKSGTTREPCAPERRVASLNPPSAHSPSSGARLLPLPTDVPRPPNASVALPAGLPPGGGLRARYDLARHDPAVTRLAIAVTCVERQSRTTCSS